MTEKVKKIVFGIFLAAILIAGVCLVILKVNEKEPVPEPIEKTFTEYVLDDFEYAKSQATDSDRVFFYEVQGVLNGELDTLTDVKVDSMITVFQVGYSAHELCRNLITKDTVEIIHENQPWYGSFDLKAVDFPITFEKAVELIKADTVFDAPASNKFVLRHPLGAYPNPVWIFGSTRYDYYVHVDAITGEVFVPVVNDTVTVAE